MCSCLFRLCYLSVRSCVCVYSCLRFKCASLKFTRVRRKQSAKQNQKKKNMCMTLRNASVFCVDVCAHAHLNPLSYGFSENIYLILIVRRATLLQQCFSIVLSWDDECVFCILCKLTQHNQRESE